MTQLTCTCTPESLCTTWDERLCEPHTRLLRRVVETVSHWFSDWHTGARSHELLESLNDQQRRDIGMDRDPGQRGMERLERERYLWHRPLL